MDIVEKIIKARYPQVKVFVNERDTDISQNSTASPWTRGNNFCTVTRTAGYDNKRQKNMYIYQVIDLTTKKKYVFYRGTFISTADLADMSDEIANAISTRQTESEDEQSESREQPKEEREGCDDGCESCDMFDKCAFDEMDTVTNFINGLLVSLPVPISLFIIKRTIQQLTRMGKIKGRVSTVSLEEALTKAKAQKEGKGQEVKEEKNK